MNRLTLSLLSLFVLACTLGVPAQAETWTDNTGNFTIEAEFSGVKGNNVVLKKPDGSTIEVPINRLSAASHARAKELYRSSMAEGAATPNAPASASPNADGNYSAPVAPAVAPMPAFPENTSLQATFDFCRDQLMAGHPEVFWHALPEDMRQMFDSRELRVALAKSLDSQQQMMKQLQGLFEKIAKVLVTKKRFVLNTPMVTNAVPPPMMPTLQQAYDPVVGSVYELGMLLLDLPSIKTQTITKMMDARGPKLGGHLKGIFSTVPMAEQAMTQVVVQQSDINTGTITVTTEAGPQTTEMVRHMGRWIPKDMADQWKANKELIVPLIKATLVAAQESEEAKQANMTVGLLVTLVGGILDPMLAAETQIEFDQAQAQIVQLIPTIIGNGGGGAPAGGFPAGPGGGFPAGPGGGFPGGPAPGGSN